MDSSISLGAKIRMQRDRNFERNRAVSRGYLEREITRIIKAATA